MKPNYNVGRNSFMCIGPKLWSNLCAEIQSVETVCVFVKRYNLSSILNSCNDLAPGYVSECLFSVFHLFFQLVLVLPVVNVIVILSLIRPFWLDRYHLLRLLLSLTFISVQLQSLESRKWPCSAQMY